MKPKHPFALYLLMFPAAFWLLAFFVAPLAIMVSYSVMQRGPYGGLTWIFTGANYLKAFDWLYLKVLLRSFGLALGTTLACLVIGYPLAYLIAFAPRSVKHILVTLLMIPFWTNFLIRTYAWMGILQERGLLNRALLWIGVIDLPLPLLFTLKGVMLGMVYGYLPFMTLPLYTSLEKLDPLLLEVSMDLGASPFQTFWRVTLPLTRPGIVAGVVLVFVPAIGEFVIPNILGGAKAMLIGNVIANQFLSARNWPFGAALTVFLILFVVLGLWAVFRYSNVEEL